ncbi:MAG: trypsin-like peptidase domain-containing protein [Planctomycetaceae bacterium]
MLRLLGMAICGIGLTVAPVTAQQRPFTSVPTNTAPAAVSANGGVWLQEAGRHLSRIAAEVNPAVVHIESDHEGRGGEVIEETGSGVIMHSPRTTGLFVVTNRHVVIGAPPSTINIHLTDGRILHPVRVLDDMSTDLAVLHLRETDLKFVRWGDSDNLDIGHVVLAVGSPFGLSQSVTMGIISAKGRRSLMLGGPREVINQDFLQTDAAINPGNSGGPLIDLAGHVVGINTAIASQGGGNEGIGFSIPSNLVRVVVEELLEKGHVQRGYLGVKLDNEFTLASATRLKLDRLRGARVVAVYDNTPAYLAGLRIDDVILNFDGIDIEDESHLIHRVSLTPVNKSVRVVVLRDGREMAVQVTLTERPHDARADQSRPSSVYQPSAWRRSQSGLRVERLDRPISMQLGYRGTTDGVLVSRLDDDAEQSGLQLYDVITEAARQPVGSVEDFVRIQGSHPVGEPLVLKVRRAGIDAATEELIVLRRHAE